MFRSGRLLVALLAFTLLAPGVATADSHSMQMDGDMSGMGSGGMMQMMDGALSDLETLEGEEFEVAYVNQIIPHHEGALEMAQAVVDRAPNGEVRDAAARIIEDQQREIEELTTFLQDKYGREVKPDDRMAMDPSMMKQMESADPAMAELPPHPVKTDLRTVFLKLDERESPLQLTDDWKSTARSRLAP